MKISVVLSILIPTPFLKAMTEFAIKALRVHADFPFELVIVECMSRHFAPENTALTLGSDLSVKPDVYIHYKNKIGPVKEINSGIRAATGDYIVICGNDMFAPPHWDTELLLPFERFKDCGASCIAAAESGAIVGTPIPTDIIVEGMYSPFTMFKKGWEYDEAFLNMYCDSDLIMRMYQAGFRSYRNNRAIIPHLVGITEKFVTKGANNLQLGKDEELFYQRWGNSPLMMFGMIRSGRVVYGKEYESWMAPISRLPTE